MTDNQPIKTEHKTCTKDYNTFISCPSDISRIKLKCGDKVLFTKTNYSSNTENGSLVSIEKGEVRVKLHTGLGYVYIVEKDIELLQNLFNKAKEGKDE